MNIITDYFVAWSFAYLLIFAALGLYVATLCKRSELEGIFLAVLFGPLGVLLIVGLEIVHRMSADPTVTESEPASAPSEQSLLADIKSELVWQRGQKEKEILRAKAAASATAKQAR